MMVVHDLRVGRGPHHGSRDDRSTRYASHYQERCVYADCGAKPSGQRIGDQPARVGKRELGGKQGRPVFGPGRPPQEPDRRRLGGRISEAENEPERQKRPITRQGHAGSEMPASIAARSGTSSRSFGRASAASIEPPPNAAKASAVSRWLRPYSACTMTTVLTITMAPAAATAMLIARRPRSRGVAR